MNRYIIQITEVYTRRIAVIADDLDSAYEYAEELETSGNLPFDYCEDFDHWDVDILSVSEATDPNAIVVDTPYGSYEQFIVNE